jgi:ADP-heptose:LPS heptosyltransferase
VKREPGNILIFRVGFLGDTIVALPALWRIRESFPNARITYLTNADINNPHFISAKDVLPTNGLIDDWMSYPSGSASFGFTRAYAKLAGEIRQKNFDTLFYLMPRSRSRIQAARDKVFFRAAGISNIIGAGYLASHRLPIRTDQGVWEVESEIQFLLHSLDHDGVPNTGQQPKSDLCLTSRERAAADLWISETTGSPVGKTSFFAVAPGSKWDSKVWPLDRFGRVGETLIGHHGLYPIIFGGAEDREIGDRLIERWSIGANAAGSLNVRESAAALARCDLYLGNDTGTMHLAAAVGVPCVAIFAAVDWIGRWVPFGEGHRVLRSRVKCEGCHSPVCFHNGQCLDQIWTEDVIDACASVIEQRKQFPVNQNRTSGNR